VALWSCAGGPRAPSPEPVPPPNLWEPSPRLLSGSAPGSDAHWEYLRSRGVRTLLSVDGQTPDVATIRRMGMRSVHLPLAYRAIPRDVQMRIARAVRDLPGPIYLHCHHGKHRGPAAAASALVLLGEMTPEEGEAFLHRAGTSPHYPGLFACVRALAEADPAAIDAVAADFPEVAPTPGLVRSMVEMQSALDHLTLIRDAGWRTPIDHPDLVPAAEAGRLVDLHRKLTASPGDPSAEYAGLAADSLARARAVERGLVDGQDVPGLTRLLASLADSCNACHARFRGAERPPTPAAP